MPGRWADDVVRPSRCANRVSVPSTKQSRDNKSDSIITTLGFIGLGVMGEPMCANLARASDGASAGDRRNVADAGDVDTVMVDLRVLVRHGKVSAVDEDAMPTAAEHASQGAWSRFAQRHGAYVAPVP